MECFDFRGDTTAESVSQVEDSLMILGKIWLLESCIQINLSWIFKSFSDAAATAFVTAAAMSSAHKIAILNSDSLGDSLVIP